MMLLLDMNRELVMPFVCLLVCADERAQAEVICVCVFVCCRFTVV